MEKMTDTSVCYTVTSTDPSNYDTIRTNLQVPIGDMCRLLVTNLTTKASFIVLGKNDYVVINGEKINMNDNYGELSTEGFAALLNELLTEETGVGASIDNVGRLVLSSTKAFNITDMSYNTKMISGFYNDPLPLSSVNIESDGKYYIRARSVGYPLLTPILYLVSNLGAKCYDNVDELYCDRKILMRVSNSFTAGYPIINSNAEFSSIIPVNSLSNIEFKLVDANMHRIELLSPMYLSIQADMIENQDEAAKIDVNQLQQQGLQQQQQSDNA